MPTHCKGFGGGDGVYGGGTSNGCVYTSPVWAHYGTPLLCTLVDFFDGNDLESDSDAESGMNPPWNAKMDPNLSLKLQQNDNMNLGSKLNLTMPLISVHLGHKLSILYTH